MENNLPLEDAIPVMPGESKYDCPAVKGYLLNLFTFVGTVFSLSLLYPVVYYFSERWKLSATYIDGKRLTFEGKLWHCYGIYLSGLVFAALSATVITFLASLVGKYLPQFPSEWVSLGASAATTAVNAYFLTKRLLRWKKKHTHFADETHGESGLRHNLFRCALVSVLNTVLSVLTLGIVYPLTYRLKYGYYTNSSIIDGKKLVFRGKLSALYGRWVLWILLTIATLGLYLPLIAHNLQSWATANTFIDEEEDTPSP